MPLPITATKRTKHSPTFILGVLIGSVGALLWGFSGVCAQFLYANYDIEPLFIVMVRSACACFFFMVLLFTRFRTQLHDMFHVRENVRQVLVFGITLLGSQTFYVLSINATNAGTATVLQMSYMVFVMLFSVIVLRIAPTLRQFLGFLCAVVGTWLIATQGDFTRLYLPLAGLIFGLLNGLSAAGYVIAPKNLLAKFGSIATTGCGMAVAAPLAALVWVLSSAGRGQFNIPVLDGAGLLALVGGVSFVGTFVAFAMYLYGVEITGAVTGGLIGALEPVGAMFISALWLSTTFSGADWLGFAFMLVLLVLVTIPSKHR